VNSRKTGSRERGGERGRERARRRERTSPKKISNSRAFLEDYRFN
jgi:hypothetical protein